MNSQYSCSPPLSYTPLDPDSLFSDEEEEANTKDYIFRPQPLDSEGEEDDDYFSSQGAPDLEDFPIPNPSSIVHPLADIDQ